MHRLRDLKDVLRLQKERRSFGGFTNAITNALSITSSSSNQNLPVLKRQATHASCSGNWLSHFDWDGQRRALHCTLLAVHAHRPAAYAHIWCMLCPVSGD